MLFLILSILNVPTYAYNFHTYQALQIPPYSQRNLLPQPYTFTIVPHPWLQVMFYMKIWHNPLSVWSQIRTDGNLLTPFGFSIWPQFMLIYITIVLGHHSTESNSFSRALRRNNRIPVQWTHPQGRSQHHLLINLWRRHSHPTETQPEDLGWPDLVQTLGCILANSWI